MYLAKAKDHIPFDWFNATCDYLEQNVDTYDGSTELGKKESNLHGQFVFGANCHSDEGTLKRISTEIKAVIGVRWGDGSGCKLQLKELVAGQTLTRMIGYVRKDRALSHFRNRNKNITAEQIAEGIAEHESLSLSYYDNAILLTRNNLFQKTWQYWNANLAPTKVRFSQVMTDMLNIKPRKFVLSSGLLMNSSGQMRRSAAEVYWVLIMGGEITEYDVCHLIYQPKGAFGGIDYLPQDTREEAEPVHGMFGSDTEDLEGGEAPETADADAAE